MQIEYKYFDIITNDFVSLTEELDAEFSVKNGEKQNQYNEFNRLEGIKDIVLAYAGNKAVGCGSIKRYSDSEYEVKRVYVKKEFRGNGISKQIMKALETKAKKKGLKALILETNRTFIEAVGLYKGLGYKEIENYGQYKNMTASVCLKKDLTL